MTIKEMEVRSGMTRANIRFYEAEGMLRPARLENGYRDYSEEDLTALKRIKLLRTLGLPLNEIKEVQLGGKSLREALGERENELLLQQKQNEKCLRICEQMREDRAEYQTLNAQKYLDSIERESTLVFSPVASDRIEPSFIPWRRFFARSFDRIFYLTCWIVPLCLGLHVNFANFTLWQSLVFLSEVVLEPLVLSRFSTTPGKWLFGITVTDELGNRLSYSKAMRRYFKVYFWGMGLGVPVFRLIRLAICYNEYWHGRELRWENESEETVKDQKNSRVAAVAAASAFLCVVSLLSAFIAMWPPHWGSLTVPEFCENFNHYIKFYSLGVPPFDSAGNWERGFFVPQGQEETVEFQFETDPDGAIEQIVIQLRQTGQEKLDPQFLLSDCREITELALLSYTAPRGRILFSLDKAMRPLDRIDQGYEEDFTMTICWVDVDYKFELENMVYDDLNFHYEVLPGRTAAAEAVITLKKV